MARANAHKRTPRGEAVIVFVAADQTFAISAGAVEEIRNAAGLRPLQTRGKVLSLLERDSGTHYVVDAARHFQLGAVPPRHVLLLRHSDVALAIDAVERMTVVQELYALPRAFSGNERRWYRGLALIDGHVVPVVNPETILTKAELAALVAGSITA